MFLNVSVLNTLNIFTDLKGPKENIICTMDDVRGDVRLRLDAGLLYIKQKSLA